MKTNGHGKTPSRSRTASGFTLVEMLLVVVILGVLAAIVYQNYGSYSQRARIAATKTQIGTIKGAIAAYEIDMGGYPSTHEGLRSLVQRPNGATGWHGPYIEKIPMDSWRNDFIYVFPGKHNPDTFEVISAGPDGIAGTADDITSWNLDE